MSKPLVLSGKDEEEEVETPLVAGTLVRCEYPQCGSITYGKVVSIKKCKYYPTNYVKVRRNDNSIVYCAERHVYRL